MKIKEQVLAVLEENKGAFMSGEKIASRLYVTRAAVGKAVNALRAEGFSFDSATNKGYRYLGGPDIFTEASIRPYLRGEAEKFRIDLRKTVSSTNAAAKGLAGAGEPEGTVVVAEEQTAGRGRLGRSFFSPRGTGLYMTLILRPSLPADKVIWITTAAAVAVAQAIESVSDKAAQIKWVNDVYIDGKKVCGILTEAAFSMENGGMEYAVLGIGVNVFAPENGFPGELRDIVTAVRETPENGLRSHLAGAVLTRFMELYSRLERGDFIEEYRRRNLAVGRRVTVTDGRQSYPAEVTDIDRLCQLIVRTEDGVEKTLRSGEISIHL